jgi:site-specific DNA-cytosine methylase
VIENVVALTTSRGGADFARIRSRLESSGFDVATAIIDAQHFVPQSRERVFLIAARDPPDIGSFVEETLSGCRGNPISASRRSSKMAPHGNDSVKTNYRLSLMSMGNRLKLDGAIRRAKAISASVYGCAYRRMRNEGGDKGRSGSRSASTISLARCAPARAARRVRSCCASVLMDQSCPG